MGLKRKRQTQFEEFEFLPRKKSVKQVLVLISLFMISGIAVDLLVYPSLVETFSILRVVITIFLLSGWILVSEIKKKWQLTVVTHLFILLPVFGIEWMIFRAQDPSLYYGGVSLMLVGTALLLRWRLWDSIVNGVLCFLSFLFLMSYCGFSYRESVIPTYFVFFSAVISILATYFNYENRYREFWLVKKVQESNKRLLVADETKARFFANISHELRTPLTLILGPLENLRVSEKYKADSLLNEHLDMMEDNAMRLLRLVNDILDLVKLDSGESEPFYEAMEVEEFIDGLANNLRPIASLKNLNFFTRCDSSKNSVVCLDRERVEKIILNLVVNAFKFTPSGGRVLLGAETNENEIIITVDDTGEGIEESVLKNVFVRFWQADMSSKRKHRGAGIGLALVKSLTETMNGEIFVKSKIGEGTIFTVKIPLLKKWKNSIKIEDRGTEQDVLEKYNEQAKFRGLIRASGEKIKTVKRKELKEKEGGRKKVLVAEDEDSMRAFILRQLKDYEVIEAGNGSEALRLAKEKIPDIIILDLMMPQMDGVELTLEIKKDPKTSRIPIILLTAHAREDIRVRALESGVNDFLTKPFSSVELLARVKNLILSSEYEMELAEANTSLKSANSRLKEQSAMLLQTEQLSSLGRMSAGIVHEINNPLNYTSTALHILKTFERQLPEENRKDYKEVLSDASEGVGRVVNIVRGLRSFTRGDSSSMEEVVIAEVIESARKLSSEELKDISFISTVSKEWKVKGNEVQLCQLFVNIFQNAIRAIKVKGAGEGSIHVSAESAKEGEEMVVHVKDTGCGISEEDLDRIFEPFFTKNNVGEGLGLGLSISYRILKQHSARIEVKSELHKYSLFSIFFPSIKP